MASGTLSLGMRKALIPGALAIVVASSFVTTLQAAERHGVALPPSTAPHLIQGPQQGLSPEIEAKARQALSALEEGDTLKALQIQQEVMRWVRSKLSKSHPFYAESLAQLGRLLGRVGRESDALVATRESVVIYRELAKLDRRYVHALSKALSEMSIQLYANDLRPLVAVRPRYQIRLAMLLKDRAVVYSKLNQYHSSLASAEEALLIFRKLANGDTSYDLQAAQALLSIGTARIRLAKHQEAILPLQEALEGLRIFAKKADVSPSPYDLDIAEALLHLGIAYGETGRDSSAATVETAAVNFFRPLAKAHPMHGDALVRALQDLSITYYKLDQLDRAIVALEESQQILRQLVNVDPDYKKSLDQTIERLEFLKMQKKSPPRQPAMAKTYRLVMHDLS